MNLKFIAGLGNSAKIPMGGRELWEVWGAGPASYNQTTGDPVNMPAKGEYMSGPAGLVTSASGNYDVSFQPSSTNILRPTWIARWWFANAAGGQSVAKVTSSGGSGMTAGTYALTIAAPPAGGIQAVGYITVTTSTVTALVITAPGAGYTSVPSVSAATGGTPPTLTAVLSTAGGEVNTGAVLSAESIQFLASGGEY